MNSAPEKKGPPKPNTVKQILDAVLPRLELFHDPEGIGYASIREGGHLETHAIKAGGMRRWLNHIFYQREKRPIKSSDMADVLDVLDAKAQFDGQERPVFLRVANLGDRCFLDLGGANWDVTQVTGDGWKIIHSLDCPVRFRRTPGMLALPEPEWGGSLEELQEFLNFDADSLTLAVSWALAALHGRGPYPILVVNGQQGTGKTTAVRCLRSIIDPSTAMDRGAPGDVRDAVISCENAWIQSWDNLSAIKPELSDVACRIATGAGFTTRKLFTDNEEHLAFVCRPVIVNGIADLLTRGDFAERALVVRLQPIPAGKRKTEADFWREFEAAKPTILGALLDAISGALWRLPDTHLRHLPRMADFVKFIVAAEPSCPWPSGGFLSAYMASQREGQRSILEGDPVVQAILSLARKHQEGGADGAVFFRGPSSLLLERLAAVSTHGEGWPRSAKGLSNHLERIAPALVLEKIKVEHRRTATSRLILLSFLTSAKEKEASQASSPQEVFENQCFDDDTLHDTCLLDASLCQRGNVTSPPASVNASSNASLRNPHGCLVQAQNDECDATRPPVVHLSRPAAVA